MASDDTRLPERLAALPPPPPRSATARVNGDHVLVTWEASPALAGHVHYRVMRNEGRAPASPAEGTAVVTQTERQDIADADAPPGTGIFYSVFAARGGTSWSPPAMTQSMTFTPDVTELSVETGESAVVLSWQVHPGTDSVARHSCRGPPATGAGGRYCRGGVARRPYRHRAAHRDRVLLPDRGVVPFTGRTAPVVGWNRRIGGSRARA